MRHVWEDDATDGNPNDPKRLIQQRCSECGAIRQKRADSKRYGPAWKYRKGSKFKKRALLPSCDGVHGFFI